MILLADVQLLIGWYLGAFALGYTSSYLLRALVRALNSV